MAEEQRWQEGHRLCANNRRFFGSPATHDLCSKCYRDRQQQETAVAGAASSPVSASSAFLPSSSAPAVAVPGMAPAAEPGSSPPAHAEALCAKASRCASCRKRVGLTGFKCRCGDTFCGVHRYPERHACSFDFKAAGRDAIARANPVVKCDKLKDRI